MIAEVLEFLSKLTKDQRGRVAGWLLLIDTCGAAGSLAVARLEGEPVVLAQDMLPGRSASERLLPAIGALVAGQGIALGDLVAIAIIHGPGSFTGMRVGVSAVKGLSEALRIPVIAISRLAVLAGKAANNERVVGVLAAGRGEFYAGEYRGDECVAERMRTRDEVLSLAQTQPRPEVIACEAAVAEAFGALDAVLTDELLAADALPLAVSRLAALSFSDIATLDAHYVRRTDAEIFVQAGAASRVE
ncbi:MAG: hypothetical protein NVSMB62_11510 [Acidobacteriaceae bacterium]